MKYRYIILSFAFLPLLFSSCKTTPQAPEAPIPTIEENLAEEAEKARAKAIENEADKLYPDLFAMADKKLREGKSLEKTNKDEAIKTFSIATTMYNTLTNLSIASKLKKEIDDMGFIDKEPDKYNKANSAYEKALSEYGKDIGASFKDSEMALSLYEDICNLGYIDLIEGVRSIAKAEKEKCDSINASRSQTRFYNEAIGSYNQGSRLFKEKHYRNAYMAYKASAEQFGKTYKTAEEKMREARAALARAKAKLQESSSLAREADRASPLADNAEGFGELDSSSLENRDSKKEEVDEISDDE